MDLEAEKKKEPGFRDEILQSLMMFAGLPGMPEVVKDEVRLMTTQDAIEKKMFKIGCKAINGTLCEKDFERIVAVADYFELVLAGLETFEESLEAEIKPKEE